MTEHIGKLNAAIYRNLQSILNSRLKDISIGSGQYDFFYVISLHEGITQKELSQWLYIGKSTTAKVVKSLLAQGYIRKEKDSADKRYERLYLTEKGRQITPLIHETFLETVELSTRHLSEQEVQQTVSLLKKILANVCEEKEKINTESDESSKL
jgi:DNA-binding MarR family transcriptional regulator